MIDLLKGVLLLTVAGAAFGTLVASLVLLLPRAFYQRCMNALISFAIGALLAAASVGLLPEAIAQAGVHTDRIGLAFLFGILLFFVLEKALIWRHCHHNACALHGHDHVAPPSAAANASRLILAGDALHNFVDGLLIAAAYLVSPNLGLATLLAIVFHEIPQEVSDLVIMVEGGMSRRTALFANALVNGMTVVGGVVGVLLFAELAWSLPYLLAIAAASLLYIALADLIPTLHQRTEPIAMLVQLIFIILGSATILLTHWMFH